MSTRRKYKAPQGYRDGGRVLQDVAIEGDEPDGFPSGILGDHLEHAGAALQDGTVPRSPPPPTEPPAAADDNPLMHALQAQTRAEEMQRDAAQAKPSSFEQKIAHLSEAKKHFLRQYPLVVEDPNVQAVFNRHYAESKAKFAEDSPEQFSHLVTETVREIEHRRQLALASESVEQATQRLEDESEAIQRAEERPAPIAPPPMPAARRSIPMSAQCPSVHQTF